MNICFSYISLFNLEDTGSFYDCQDPCVNIILNKNKQIITERFEIK